MVNGELVGREALRPWGLVGKEEEGAGCCSHPASGRGHLLISWV